METAANTPIINSWQWPKAKELPSCSKPSPSPDFSAEEQPTITDLTHQNVCSLPIGSLSNLSRSVSLNSSKSFASISTACDSCDAQKEHLSHSPGSHYSSTANSLVICNFNTSNPSIDGEFDNEPTDDEEGNFTDDEDEPEDDIDIISYRSGFSDSALASDILLAYEDEPDAEEGIPGSSQMASKQRRHILFLETHAIGRPSLAGHCEFYPLIVDKICSQSDLHQLNKYIFLLDQFARLCANYCGEEGSFRRCSFYPFLFPHPLPSQAQRPLSLRRNKYLRKQYSNCNYPLLSDYSVNSRGPNRLSKCSKAPLSYLDRPFLETYLRLIELFNQANAHKNAEEHENENGSFESGLGSLKVAHFSLKIFAQFPELIRDDLLDGSRSFQSLPRMIEHLLDPFARYEPMDNYRFVAVIRTHFHCLEEETEALSELPVEPLRIEQVFGSLYERYHLPQLFQLYHSVSRYIRTIFCKSVYRRYPEARHFDGEQKTELLNKFYELTFRHRKAPLLDTLHDLSLHTSGHVLNNDDYHRSLLVFCYRSTLYRYAHCVSSSLDRDYVHCDPTMSSSGAGSHSYDQHPIRHINEPLCSSLVGYLYKLTIQLALLASVYSPPQGQSFMELLLKIQVYDFDFKQYLQEALDIVESELNSINFDLQNRQHDNNPLEIDSDGMDEFDEQEEVNDPLPRLATLMNLGTSTASAPFFSPAIWSVPSSSSSMSSLASVSSEQSGEQSSSRDTSRPSSITPPPARVTFSSSTSYDVNNNADHLPEQSSRHRLGRPPPPNTPIDIPVSLTEKRALLDRMRSAGTSFLAPPNNEWALEECAICCVPQWVLIRVSCCSFAACLDCLGRYYTSRIEMGNLSIECIGSDCHELVYRAEVNARLSDEKKDLYSRMLLMQSSESDRAKPCPQCNTILILTPQKEREMKQASNRLLFGTKQLLGSLGLRKREKKEAFSGNPISQVPGFGNVSQSSSFVYDSLAFKVECDRCKFFWCFKCHSPWHEGLSCKQFMKGDTLLKSWAKNVDYNGQMNAQKCPKCKIYIQRTSGCDHMLCTRCKTDFCYKCGDRLRQVKFFGDHYSRLSVLGCKYRYKPDKPLQRKLIRGTVFGSKLMLLPVLSTVCLCAGAVVLALGIAALPLFGGMRVYRRIRYPTHRRANRANGTTAAHRSFAGAGRQYPVRERTVEERALDEDVWNRTIQLYNNRLRNRSNERMIRRPQVGEMHDANNNNGNSIATQTTPMTSRSFQFSWFDSSLMLDGADLEFEGDAQYHHNGGNLPHDLVSEIFHIEDIDIPEDGRIFCSSQDESLNLKRTSEMKPYNSHSGRNPVVLKFTEQDLHEIIDDNYQHDNLTSSRQQQLHRHRSGKLKASKAKKPKEVKQTKTKKGTSEGELENGKATGESSKASETAVSSVSTVELPNGRKSAMGTLMRKFTINRNTK